MVKGEKGEPLDDHHVDGMSGATMTGNGVNNMFREYLKSYEAYFKKVKAQRIAGS
jgi:Na+-transporting NADH:ubiquinone oxidoreductase subunit C